MSKGNDRVTFSTMIEALPVGKEGFSRFTCVLNNILNSFIFEDAEHLLHVVGRKAGMLGCIRHPLVVAVQTRIREQRALREMLARKKEPLSYERFRRACGEGTLAKTLRDRNR